MIKWLIMDVDGTLTDGKIYMGNEGEMFKAFDVKDGCGINSLLIPQGIIPVIITARRSKILERRCEELGIEELYQGVTGKLEKIEEISKEKKLEYSEAAYIGDDLNDLPCMGKIGNAGGIVGCPSDAAKEVLAVSDFVSRKTGGNGAVREFIEWILALNEVSL